MKLHTVVFDASTLILLAKLDLLQIAAEKMKLIIPWEVREEALAKPRSYDAQLIDRMLKDERINISQDVSASSIKMIKEQFRIDVGEAAALFLAKEGGWVLGIDDGPGIRASKILGVHFITAIHVLTEFYHQGTINRQSALAKLESLEKLGRYHAQIMEDARSRILKGR
ncbi:MAG: hypothetical protein HYT97_05690 [Elusimicrobia bacterium]|nr:hypothetical protein [Elusimicrobiota bacterium]